MTREDKILLSLLEEKAVKCSESGMITCSRFLNLCEKSLALSLKIPGDVNRVFYSGFGEGERTICIFFPDYTGVSDSEGADRWFRDNPEDCPMNILAIKKDKYSKNLTHRDYLGAVTGLGISRDVIGDIIVKEDGCFMAVSRKTAGYIAENFAKAGRSTLTLEVKYPFEIEAENSPEGMPETFTVSSLRLDSTIKNGFGISRESACEAIVKGLVFVNDIQCLKPDRKLEQGDKVVLRHKGRIIITECENYSRKGRLIVKILKF
ncbi:MAG: hypothetical protein IJJ61_00280 [Clostridia bacterium]|nr:hypothetical protein [Clostridia bacterium]